MGRKGGFSGAARAFLMPLASCRRGWLRRAWRHLWRGVSLLWRGVSVARVRVKRGRSRLGLNVCCLFSFGNCFDYAAMLTLFSLRRWAALCRWLPLPCWPAGLPPLRFADVGSMPAAPALGFVSAMLWGRERGGNACYMMLVRESPCGGSDLPVLVGLPLHFFACGICARGNGAPSLRRAGDGNAMSMTQAAITIYCDAFITAKMATGGE